MILTLADRDRFFSSVCLASDRWNEAFEQVQGFAEGPQGANRPLDKQQFTEVKSLLTKTQSCFLSYWPIDSEVAIAVETRIDSSHEWILLDAADHQLTPENQKLKIDRSPVHGGFSRSYGRRCVGLASPVGNRTGYSEVRVTYTAGFNFEVNPPSDRVLRMKRAGARILKYLYRGNGLPAPVTGVSAISDTAAATNISINLAAGAGEVPDSLLAEFRRYRAR